MKLAIMESITTPGGHEVDFDRILVEEIQALGHEAVFYVPENFVFKYDYGVPVRYLPGEGVSYTGLKGIGKMLFSVKREWNRQRWFRALAALAGRGEFDAVIIPTSTYRYLRALNINSLKHSPVPVIFIVHGINPNEAPRFFKAVEKLRDYPNVKAAVLTFGDALFGHKFPNVYCINPPAYTPRDIDFQPASFSGVLDQGRPLRLGFFGQYRREKQLDTFLDVFLTGQYKRPIQLQVQGATMNPDDSADFERIIKKYSGHPHIRFLHKGLIGKEWQTAIAGIDALLMPYSASRYRYHWAGMLFTAIGYQKPVVLSSEINPEVLAKYEIGVSFSGGDNHSLKEAIENFVNTFDDKAALYTRELDRAAADYSSGKFAKTLLQLVGRC
ncbi:MAG: glycosyltransferase [Veillonellales bacterium]